MSSYDRNRVKVSILHEEYVFISPAAPERLRRLAYMVEEKMRSFLSKESRLTPPKAAVMTAMVFADQVLSQQQRVKDLEEQILQLQVEQEKLQAELTKAKLLPPSCASGKEGVRNA